MFIAGIVVIVIAVIGLGVYAFISSRAQSSVVQERLGRYADVVVQAAPVVQPTTNKPKQSALSERLNEALRGRSFFGSMQIWLSAADLKMNVGEFFALTLITSIGGVFIALLATVIPECSAGSDPSSFISCIIKSLSSPFALIASIIAMLGGGYAPRFYVDMRKDGRFTAFNDQLGDTLNLLVNALRSGYSVLQAMEAVSKELPPPISVEFRRVVQEIQLGLPMETALEHLLERIASEDLDLVITAMNIQREVGGNLAEILDTMSHTIRERVRIKGEIATLTSQGMATGYAITGMPFALMLLLAVVNRPYIAQFFEARNQPCGWAMLVVALIMISIGGFVIKKIVTIEI